MDWDDITTNLAIQLGIALVTIVLYLIFTPKDSIPFAWVFFYVGICIASIHTWFDEPTNGLYAISTSAFQIWVYRRVADWSEWQYIQSKRKM